MEEKKNTTGFKALVVAVLMLFVGLYRLHYLANFVSRGWVDKKLNAIGKISSVRDAVTTYEPAALATADFQTKCKNYGLGILSGNENPSERAATLAAFDSLNRCVQPTHEFASDHSRSGWDGVVDIQGRDGELGVTMAQMSALLKESETNQKFADSVAEAKTEQKIIDLTPQLTHNCEAFLRAYNEARHRVE